MKKNVAARRAAAWACTATLMAGLAACVSPAEQKAADRSTCQGYGFNEGTDGFANCMMKLAGDRQKAFDEMVRKNQAAAGINTEPAKKSECKTSEEVTTSGNSTTTDSSTVCFGG